MRWLTVWLLLAAAYLGGLLICRALGGAALWRPVDPANLVFIPATQIAALAVLAATASQRRRG
jgi:hypothetical protein